MPERGIKGLFLLAAMGCVLSLAVSAEPGGRGLLGDWKFDDGSGTKAKDAVYGNDGSIVGAKWVKGVSGAALSFEGKDDYVTIPHSKVLAVGKEGEDYSVEFWFKASAKPKPDAHFLTKEGSVYPFSFVQGPDGAVQLRVYDETAAMSSIASGNISDGKWHHIVGVRDGANKRLLMYVDGKALKEENDVTLGDVNNKGPIKIGRCWGDDFSGAIDGVRIYDFAVSVTKKGGKITVKSPEAVLQAKP